MLKKVRVSLIFALIMFLTIACSAPGDTINKAMKLAELQYEQQHHPVQYLEVSDKLTWSHDGFMGHITGTIKNTATFAIDYVEVEFAEFDKDGNQIGTTFDNMTDLQPGATWKFDVPIFDNDVEKVKLINIDATVY